jgi:superfamily II RNA helicase
MYSLAQRGAVAAGPLGQSMARGSRSMRVATLMARRRAPGRAPNFLPVAARAPLDAAPPLGEDEDDAYDDSLDDEESDGGRLLAEGLALLDRDDAAAAAEYAADGDDDDDASSSDTRPPLPGLPPTEGGTVRTYAEAVIAAGPAQPGLARAVTRMFPYPLDRFQRRAVRASVAGRDVVVCAPTGAGKTAVAAAAALAALARGERVIYTTPLKALSNQKLGELRALFGPARCGLQTGDATLNPEAAVVVMTTEVLRNIMLRVPVAAGVAEGGEGGGDADPSSTTTPTLDASTPPPSRLADVGLIVLDEVHYLGDPSRGTVWEEAVMAAPGRCSLLAMSATVRNPADLGAWIAAVHRPCDTIVTASRPVPLTWAWASSGGGRGVGAATLTPLLARGSPPAAGSGGEPAPAGARLRLHTALRPPRDWDGGRGGWGRSDRDRGGGLWAAPPPSPPALAAALQAADLLPAIVFVFSRAGCDAVAADVASSRVLHPLPPDSVAAIDAALAALTIDAPDSARPELIPALRAGVAVHHAGCLPGWKSLVERLFQAGHVRVVAATETLAAGVNMPARTTVLTALVRRKGPAGPMPLTHNELLQMAGRAGRRGFDAAGAVVVCGGRDAGPADLAALLGRGPEQLASQFRPGYSMVLNLVAHRPLEGARAFVERSFAAHAARSVAAARAARVRAAEEAADAAAAVAAAAAADARFEGAADEPPGADAKREARRALRAAVRAAVARRAARAAAALAETALPAEVMLDLTAGDPAGDEAVPALVVGIVAGDDADPDPDPSRNAPNDGVTMPRTRIDGEPAGELLVLLDDNSVARVQWAHVAGVPPRDAPASPLAADALAVDAVFDAGAAATAASAWKGVPGGALAADGGGATAALAAALATREAQTPLLLPSAGDELALRAARAEYRAAKAAARRAPARAVRGRPPSGAAAARAAAAAADADRAARAAAAMRAALESDAGASWRGFEAVLAVLVAVGAVVRTEKGEGRGANAPTTTTIPTTTVALTPLGEVARSLATDNELWVATLLTHPAVQNLPPPALAAALSAVAAGELGVRPGVRAAHAPSPAVVAAVTAADSARAALVAAQRAAGIDAPAAVDLRLAGVVEAWASGATWAQAAGDCTLDAGDVARLLFRTVDVLRQASRCAALPPALRKDARKAAAAMYRAPLSDAVA